MSKRDQRRIAGQLHGRGYVPEAVLNYLALLGWSPKENRSG